MDLTSGSNILTNVYTLIGITFLILTIATILGGIIGARVAYAVTKKRTITEIQSQASEIEERVINALQGEITLLRNKITDLEKENSKLSQTLGLIKAALRKRGLSVTIDGDLVTIHDASGSSQTGRITGQGDA